jgi:hypothetical protein
MRVRKLAATVAVVALIGVGAVGVAGASSPGHGHRHGHLGRLEAEAAKVEAIAAAGKLPASFKCAHAAKDLTRIAKAESRIDAYIPKAEARQASALAAGHQKRANVIGHRIAEAQNLETALVTVASLITAACPS